MVLFVGNSSDEEGSKAGVLDRRTAMFGGVVAVTLPSLLSSTAAIAGNLLSSGDVESMISRGLDNPEVMREFRAMMKTELTQAYRNNPQSGFPAYNVSRVDQDRVMYGEVSGNVSNQIVHDRGYNAVYDNRIKGKINFDTPSEILALVDQEGLHRHHDLEQSGNIAFIMKDQNGVDVFIYYEAGRLKYIFPTTIGSGDTTPEVMVVGGSSGVNDKQLANYWKIDGERGAMPYSRRLSTLSNNGTESYEGINTHIGNVGRNKSSHGCARQGALGAAILYHTMRDNTIVYRMDKRLEREDAGA